VKATPEWIDGGTRGQALPVGGTISRGIEAGWPNALKGRAPILPTRRGSYIIPAMIYSPGQPWRVAGKAGVFHA
jgi:hypothetical protein